MSNVKSKTMLAKEMGIARSSLYYNSKKPPKDEKIKKQIEAVMAKHPAYGHRRIAIALAMNHKKVLRIMNIFGLKPAVRRKRKAPAKPDDVNRPDTKIPNMARGICPLRANVLWAGDFTYIWFSGCFWYLATVIDVYTREIIGWHIAKHHTSDLIIKAFQDARKRTKMHPVWFHSDQGSEYVSGAYQKILAADGTLPSHSNKSSPWHNGHQESFYSQFKLELGDPARCDHLGELIEAIHMQIHYYNNDRIHTALKMPPVMYRINRQKMTVIAVNG